MGTDVILQRAFEPITPNRTEWHMLKRLQHTFAVLTITLIAYILVGCTVSQAAEPTPAPSVPWTPIPVVQAITPTVRLPTSPPPISASTLPTDTPTDTPSLTLTETDAASPLPPSATPIPTNTRHPTITPTPTLAV